MERLKNMKEILMSCVQGQLGNLAAVDTKELGEAVDMIKDLEEAIYYCTITKAMEEKEKEQVTHHYYTERYIEPYEYPHRPWERDMDRDYGRMYYGGRNGNGNGNGGNGGSSNGNGNSGMNGNSSGRNGNGNGSSNGGTRNYYEEEFYLPMRDRREGRSPERRKMYMESKEMHRDKSTQLKELEKYMQELGKDVVEMIEGASPEEQQFLGKKITELANKITQV